MRFMVFRRADANTEAGVIPGTEVFEAMNRYVEEAVRAGIFLSGEGLQPSSRGAVVRLRGGKASVIDGPFTEAKELVAGFAIIQAASREEAIEWVKRWPHEDGDLDLEIRPILEVEDLGPNLTPELRAAEEKLRAETPTWA